MDSDSYNTGMDDAFEDRVDQARLTTDAEYARGVREAERNIEAYYDQQCLDEIAGEEDA